MGDDDFTSFTHAAMVRECDQFEREFEWFLSRPSTPIEARQHVAGRTIERLLAIVERLRAQGVL